MRSLLGLLIVLVLAVALATAQEEGAPGERTPQDGTPEAGPPESGIDVRQLGRWPTDRVRLPDGRQVEGWIRHEDRRGVEVVEVGRQPGRPMYLLVRWIPRDEIAGIERLEGAQRRELEQRISWFRQRTQIAAVRAQKIELTRRPEGPDGPDGDVQSWHYEGPWFHLDSTADQPLTREVIVRVEQMVAGFRTFFPPRHQPDRLPRIVLLNTSQEYLAYQQRAGLKIQHAAFFDHRRNEVVAGGELATLRQQLAQIDQHHQGLRDRYEALQGRLQERLSELSERLEEEGYEEAEIRAVRIAARRQWNQLRKQQEGKIRAAERANEALFQEKFRELYHEAFHAYLENYVFDPARYDVPRWLNEGLAQVFESGLWEAGVLRLDAPDPALLAALQADLQGAQPLPLGELLAAPVAQFLVRHGQQAGRSHRLYLYSWGLAYYLIFEGRLLDSAALEQYLGAGQGQGDPQARFEALVKMPLGKFQAQWRAAMVGLGP